MCTSIGMYVCDFGWPKYGVIGMCMHMCVYVCVYVCVCLFVCTKLFRVLNIFLSLLKLTRAWRLGRFIHAYVNTYIHTYIHTHVYIYVYTHTYSVQPSFSVCLIF